MNPRSYKLLPCPFCGADTTVSYARSTRDGVFRRRRCADCGRTFSTEERIVGLERSGNAISAQTLLEALAFAGVAIAYDFDS